MDSNEVTVMVDVKGRPGSEANKEQDVLKVPYHLLWEDLRLMLMLNFDCQDVAVKYVDEDSDEIAVNSQDELFLAFMMAKRNNDILYLKLECLSDQSNSDNESDGGVEFRDDIPPTRVRSPFTILTPTAPVPEVGGPAICFPFRPPENIGLNAIATVGTEVPDYYSPIQSDSTESPTTESSSISNETQKKVVQDLSDEVKETVGQILNEEVTADMDSAINDEVGTPPAWFCNSLAKFKREIVDDISHTVCQRTVKNILKGLDGAVITSVQTNGTASSSGTPTAATPAEAATPATDATEPPVSPLYHHPNIICDNCEKSIVGIRFKCGNCPDFDLCETCEAIEGIHDADHVFLKLRRPTQANRFKNGLIVPLLKHSLYEVTEDNQKWIDKIKNFEAKMQRKVEKEMRKIEKREEKHQKREERRNRVIERRDERLKRKCERTGSGSQKREKLDLPQFKSKSESYEACFVGDVSVDDGMTFAPGTRFTKIWALLNSGHYGWEKGTKLRMLYGNLLPVDYEAEIYSAAPGETSCVQVEFIAPQEPGTYRSDWRLYSPNGKWFGHRIWCKIVVDPAAEEDLQTIELQRTEEVMQTQDVVEEQKGEEETNEQEQNVQPEEEAEAKISNEETEQVEIEDDIAPIILEENDTKSNEAESPEIELNQARKRLSTSSSSLELLDMGSPHEEVSPSSESQANSSTMSLVTERMLALKPAVSVDYSSASLDSTTIDWSDTDSESDFYVVPIPDCFNPNLPMTNSTSTSVIVPRDDVKKCLGMNSLDTESYSSKETLNADVDDVVIVSEDVAPESFENVEQDQTVEQAELEEFEDESIVRVEESMKDVDPVVATTEVIEENTEEIAQCTQEGTELAEGIQKMVLEEPDKVLKEIAETAQHKDQIVADMLKAHRHAAKNIQDQILKEQERVLKEHEQIFKEQERVIKEQQDAIEQQVQQVVQVQEEETAVKEVPTEPKEPEQATSPTSESRKPPSRSSSGHHLSSSPTQIASTVLSSAVAVAGQAAASAYSTARDVFHTLQARNKHVPKTSTWTPTTTTWTPPPDTWTPPVPTATPSPRVLTPMDQLIEMGFANRDLNRELLQKHNNNVEAVVSEILQSADNDWNETRH